MSLLPLNKKYGIILFGLVLLLIASVPSIYFYRQNQRAQERLKNPSIFAEEEAKQLVATVSTIIDLPADETPTIATVTDSEKLKDQPFFARSQQGDKVLIYSKSLKAILYRPSTNKIIEVAPVNIGQNATPSAQLSDGQAPTVSPVSIVLLNGTTVVGLTKKFETELVAKAPEAKILDRNNAKKNDYKESLLVDVTGTKATAAQALATSFGLKIGTLPEGESTPSADFVIILGDDKK